MKVLSHRARIDACGGQVLAVVCDEPDRVRAGLLRGIEDPYPVLVDIPGDTYRSWGLGRAPRLALARHPAWIRDYATAALRGTWRARPGHDILRLGGDFVVAPDGELTFARPQTGFDDRPPAGELVAALERSGQSAP